MVVNPAGFVPIFDFGAPRVISGRARMGITGGQLVFASGPAGAVSSGANSFAVGDITFATPTSGTIFTGVALQTVGSNDIVSVAVDGVIISTCDATVTAASTVITGGNDSIGNGTAAGTVVGRAITGAASGGYALWHIQG